MPGYIQHVGATLNCGHGGSVTIVSTNSRVLVNKQPVATVSDTWTVSGGCPVVMGSSAYPCVSLRWITPSGRVRVNGQFVVTTGSTGLSLGAAQAPQGSPIAVVQQTRVSAL